MLNNTSEIVYESPDGDGLVSKSSRWSLSNDRITDRSDGNHVAKVRKDKHDTNCQLGLFSLAESKTTDSQVAAEDEQQTGHVESGSADMGEQEPADNTTNDVASGK